MSNKTEHFSYSGGYDMMCKEELAWAIDKQLRVIINMMLVINTTKELKNRAIINLKQYCMNCYMILVMYSNYFEWSHVC